LRNTSEILNQCINKKKLKEQVKKVNKNDIEILEMHLAEKIIDNYEKMKNIIR